MNRDGWYAELADILARRDGTSLDDFDDNERADIESLRVGCEGKDAMTPQQAADVIAEGL